MTAKPLFDIPFLASRWDDEYRDFQDSNRAEELLDRLRSWDKGEALKETSSEAAFIKQFFFCTWGYSQEGDDASGAFECYPQFPVEGAGQGGNTGQADLALGFFDKPDLDVSIPQVLCEFKDTKSTLDKKQNRKGSQRSPVEQCLDYLRGARTKLSGHEPVKPFWAIVTDMYEFRLYCSKHGQSQCQRFVIRPGVGDDQESLLADTGSARFSRFLFWKLFHKTSLLTDRGPSYLQQLLDDQIIHEQSLEKDFYLEYKKYREYLYETIRDCNRNFPGTPGQLVRLTQRLLDRCLFVLFCEDMGKSLEYPVNLLRDVLIEYSTDKYYNSNDNMPWERLKSIFSVMGVGGSFGDHQINRFNGGLFEPLPELEGLHIPAKVFCAKGQGEHGVNTLLAHPLTLLFLSAKYNFGIKDAGHDRVIDFYALGRIFEQSITELEIMEAEADGRESINLLSKRKRNGVYYTPEWVTDYIVRETVGTRLASFKSEFGLLPEKRPSSEENEKYRASLKAPSYHAPVRSQAWVDGLEQYRICLNQIRIVDPACGSGAFLIQALEYLKGETRWLYQEFEYVRGTAVLWEVDAITKAILTNNLYGVDINQESVEIAKLALWMHTAVAGKPLSSLDHNIRCGNSLVGPDFDAFFNAKHDSLFVNLDESERERINAFDWIEAFPEVFSQGGFDCVIGNPPYVKLQNFRRVEADVAEYLVNGKTDDDSPVYFSTQVGNFDLYLPFIEKGISLLRPEGCMGYIAPNVWMVNEYGRALRQWLKQHQHLDRWIDFKSYQVFEEATTYTAIQLFHGSQVDAIRCAFAPDGDISAVDWNSPTASIPYDSLSVNQAWDLLPQDERSLIIKLNQKFRNLGDAKWTRHIFQGIITSADSIFHLSRVAPGTYMTKSGNLVPIEDSLMRPLVSGGEAKRYMVPKTNKYLLSPYDLSAATVNLFNCEQMERDFPMGWSYLRQFEPELRAREKGIFDDPKWYRFGRNQNIDKQELPKLCVAQTVPKMRVCFDSSGEFFINNVRVNGIIAETTEMNWYLLGILNSPLIDFVFRRISKPKDGGYFEANKQFIAPLPIPDATDDEKMDVGNRAIALQAMHTERRDKVESLDSWLSSDQMSADKRKQGWLWADTKSTAEWSKEKSNSALRGHLQDLDLLLSPGAVLSVENQARELHLLIGDRRIVSLFGQPDTLFIAAQWRQIARTTNITNKFTAKRLVAKLLNLRSTEDSGLRESVVEIDAEIQALGRQIDEAEIALNKIVFQLYDLTKPEIQLVLSES